MEQGNQRREIRALWFEGWRTAATLVRGRLAHLISWFVCIFIAVFVWIFSCLYGVALGDGLTSEVRLAGGTLSFRYGSLRRESTFYKDVCVQGVEFWQSTRSAPIEYGAPVRIANSWRGIHVSVATYLLPLLALAATGLRAVSWKRWRHNNVDLENRAA